MRKINRKGGIKRKLALLLMGGFVLSLTRTPKQYFEVLGEITDEFRGIKRSNVKRAIKSLYKNAMVEEL
ncbi:MAG: hypothetical protein WCT19_01480 [Candidatus Paceibacterota bacterium]|jgi:hypothetical protein